MPVPADAVSAHFQNPSTLHDSISPTALPLSPACQKRRAQIIKGAGKVFLRLGYEGASMSVIAREAGVSKGALYNHFVSKAELFTAFFEDTCRTKLDAIESLPRTNDVPLQAALEEAALMLITMLSDAIALGLYRIIVGEAEHFPHLADTFWRYAYARTLGGLARWFEARMALSPELLAIEDPYLAAEQFCMMCQTRIIQRKRFMLPVDDSPQAIQAIAQLTARSFMRIHAP
ncbi:TetR/AcrR family transcriptional regulator [Formicincola oecophyllae]|uniref:TetR/AcrR family transcriptional regulator n=1 Tax=Formicincola oecophyllae TaxID=2558361 RepID=A0A4Y6U7N8_9PROT|nr:TetR/AcrR family transcriptional regulator [Formicincola oecophyllae]QDH13174.1 TetR/AcrR family transcriptional regulator [Formicincola oecophyllae]